MTDAGGLAAVNVALGHDPLPDLVLVPDGEDQGVADLPEPGELLAGINLFLQLRDDYALRHL